jgi:hypothetical protein
MNSPFRSFISIYVFVPCTLLPFTASAIQYPLAFEFTTNIFLCVYLYSINSIYLSFCICDMVYFSPILSNIHVLWKIEHVLYLLVCYICMNKLEICAFALYVSANFGRNDFNFPVDAELTSICVRSVV